MKSVTVPCLKGRKAKGEKIVMLTAYDYPSAQLMDGCGIDIILVGDSCAMTVMGRDNTLSITVDELLHHVCMVSRAAKRALVIADMPFMSYHISPDEAVRNAGRFIAEGGAQAVKVEGPVDRIGPALQAILDADIPVMGHLGLTPQSIHALGGFKVQGKSPESAALLVDHAKALEDIGCFSIVLECVPAEVGAKITEAVSIPTIGIGAGPGCDGQVLVMHDILGWGKTRFAKTYADVRGQMEQGFKDFADEVRSGAYPGAEQTYK